MTILMSDIQFTALSELPILEKNSEKRDWVIALQHILNGCGYSVRIDGSFGQKTLDAVNTFQQDLNLDSVGVTLGIVETKTWQAFENHRKIGGWRSM